MSTDSVLLMAYRRVSELISFGQPAVHFLKNDGPDAICV